MRALRMLAKGDLESLEVISTPTPEAGHGQVLVRVEAASINPSDIKNAQGAFGSTTFPRIPGRDFVGIVEQGPAEWHGRRVWGSGGMFGFTSDGAHAEYIVRGVDEISPAPSNLPPAQAAACGVPFVTAYTALFDAADLSAAETVVIIGAAGSVGSSAVQLAIRDQAKVIGVIRREEQAEATRRLGCVPLISPEGDRLGEAVREIAPDGASLIFDTVGGSMMRNALAALSTRGRLVEITAPQREVTFDLLDFYRRDLRLIGVNTVNLDAATCSRILDILRPGFEAGELTAPAIDRSIRIEDAPSVYREAAAGKTGKVVIEF